jgi:hypothetical protein
MPVFPTDSGGRPERPSRSRVRLGRWDGTTADFVGWLELTQPFAAAREGEQGAPGHRE